MTYPYTRQTSCIALSTWVCVIASRKDEQFVWDGVGWGGYNTKSERVRIELRNKIGAIGCYAIRTELLERPKMHGPNNVKRFNPTGASRRKTKR